MCASTRDRKVSNISCEVIERSGSPPDDLLREELVNELHIVRLQRRLDELDPYILDKSYLEILSLRNIVTLAVQIVRVESLHSSQHLLILLIHELTVCALFMPRIERMIADHR